MSTGFLWYDGRAKPLSTAGAPQGGCYLCFFATGTTTPANVYSNSALSVVLSQPTPGSVNPSAGTVADSAGRFVPIYLDPSVGVYRYQLYSAAGVLLEDVDPFVAPGSPSVSFPNGSAAAPGIAFANDTTTGLYLAASHQLGFATGGIAAGAIDANQGWSIPGASGENTLTVAGSANHYAAVLNASGTSGQSFGLEINAGSTSADIALLVQNQALSATFLELFGDGHGTLGPSSSLGLSWATSGALTVAAATSAVSLLVDGAANQYAQKIAGSSTSNQSFGLQIAAGTSASDAALNIQTQGASTILSVYGDGEALLATPTAATNQTAGFYQVGYLDMPVNIVNSGAYTLAFSDRGKMVIQDAASNVVIPAHTITNFPVGTTIMVCNNSGSTIDVTLATDTLVWLPSNTSGGTRVLASYGIATLVKVTSTEWFIFGFGIT